MLAWLSENLASIVIVLIVAALVVAVIVKMRKDKKSGKSTCGGNCGCCPMGGSCSAKNPSIDNKTR